MRISAPGKVFLLGEYGVLAGGEALIATMGPRFSLTTDAAHSALEAFATGSPAGRLMRWAEDRGAVDVRAQFEDPFGGKGGFGASSAQFLLLYRAIAPQLGLEVSWRACLKLFRELMEDGGGVLPSGADVVAQWVGGLAWFRPSRNDCEDLSLGWDGSRVLVFAASSQAGRKVATHVHLQELTSRGFPKKMPRLLDALSTAVNEGVHAVSENSASKLGAALTSAAEALAREGLEIEATRLDREALARLPGVLGVKGAGALQADAIVVVAEDASPVIAAAAQRGLRLVARGLGSEPGCA